MKNIELIKYMDSVIKVTGKVTLYYGENQREVTLTGKASDVFTIDENYAIKLVADGEILEIYNTDEEVKLVIDDMASNFKFRPFYYFDPADVISEQMRDEKIWNNVIKHLIKTFKIDRNTAYSMAQVMLEGSDMSKFKDWENK